MTTDLATTAAAVTPTAAAVTPTGATGEAIALAALLRCAVRELATPAGHVLATADGHTLVDIGGGRVRVRFGGGIALDLHDDPEILTGDRWGPLTLHDLVTLVERELPGGNAEFAAQVRANRAALDRIGTAPTASPAPAQTTDDARADVWLHSEQSLTAGHPFHPSPKAHLAGGAWTYAPERAARFPLRLFAVPADRVVDHGDAAVLDRLAPGLSGPAPSGPAPSGHVVLPVHPWQAEALGLDIRPPDGLRDLGTTAAAAIPTSSLRTVYVPELRRCLKLSLHLRITNCVRKNAWYELAGAVELSRRLRPVAADLDREFPGTRVLAEPGTRGVAGDVETTEGLGVIVRDDPIAAALPGTTPLVAAALAQPGGPYSARVLAAGDAEGWWDAYLRVVALPVLYAYARHGVAFEAHVQNVLVGVDADGRPRQAILRDLEGTKLVADRHDLRGLDLAVAAALAYSPDAAWRRVVYCLVVNQLAHVASVLAGSDEALLGRLWARASSVLVDQPWADASIAALATVRTLPAKANLSVRWARGADRDAGYVAVPNPLRR